MMHFENLDVEIVIERLRDLLHECRQQIDAERHVAGLHDDRALAGALRGPQMGSFMENDGRPIGCGQFFIAIEPGLFSGGDFDRQVAALKTSITAQEGARLPNARREANARRLKVGNDKLEKDDALAGLTAVVTVRLAEPQFEGQTKEVLGTNAVRAIVARVVEKELTERLLSTRRGEKHVFRSGPLSSAILASTAIPGVFEPVVLGGDQFVDGCVTASVDMTTAMEMGATEILAIDLTPPATPASSSIPPALPTPSPSATARCSTMSSSRSRACAWPIARSSACNITRKPALARTMLICSLRALRRQ